MRQPEYTQNKTLSVECPHCNEKFETDVYVEAKTSIEIEVEVS